jgi:hypothetical protein
MKTYIYKTKKQTPIYMKKLFILFFQYGIIDIL